MWQRVISVVKAYDLYFWFKGEFPCNPLLETEKCSISSKAWTFRG